MYSINWETFFDNRHDNDLGNQDSTILSDAWSQMTSQIEIKAFISNDNSIVILTSNANNTITILHKFKKHWKAHLFARSINLSALSERTSMPRSSTSRCPPSQPPSNSLPLPSTTCNSAAEITSLPAPAINAPVNFHGCYAFLPAPWLLSTILEANSNGPIKLIVECHQAAILFD